MERKSSVKEFRQLLGLGVSSAGGRRAMREVGTQGHSGLPSCHLISQAMNEIP